MKWTPWIKFTGDKRPEGLADNRRMQVVFINCFGEIRLDGVTEDSFSDRSVGSHHWDADTLACGIVGKDGIAPDTWYRCEGGKLVEVA